jgi:hypothetical protein
MKILICFDRKDESDQALDAVKKGGPKHLDPHVRYDTQLSSDLEKFFAGVKVALDGKKSPKSAFDGYDLIFLDNNLTHLDIKGARLTGEGVAGYLRAFTDTPYVVSVNKNPDLDFDLQGLVGDASTRADLAINTSHLENRALWTGSVEDARDGFRPWYWPALDSEPVRRRRQIRFVQSRLKKPILSTLDFDRRAILALSRTAKGVLSPEGRQPGSNGESDLITRCTFEDFFRSSSRSVPAEDDRVCLLEIKNRLAISRVVASDLDMWFRRDVVAPQDVIVDVSHLLSRMPFLLGHRASGVKAWNNAIQKARPPFGLDKSIYKRYLSKARCRLDLWIRSPSFWWTTLKDSEKLNQSFFRAEKEKWADCVFCEDISAFVTRGSGVSAPQEFVADFESPWDRRYVRRLTGKRYVPRSRMAL